MIKRIFIIGALLLFTSSFAIAEDTYTPVTKDNEVTDINKVIVQESSPTISLSNWSLERIDGRISNYKNTITALQTDVDELQAIRVKVKEVADTVKLAK